ncbi:peptidoglycan D,D-transpeptidase FtsI family protein [Paenibacillus thermoaerophilus]|uniref:Peptidoglycan D,D-transpeptidase FtsI family protein n=1 Tax=Paenibacillus thermoaerophilus TaxID=1215385 RepID=A0ABW2V167_9BACL|nr:penicillin-binding transpeptidase domain-containing protein [Paenibacillus thermoaerophilus]TMV18428.1 penicillin-binding protein 2 [Paenibacillus thermoaerophilus]
MSRYGKVGGDDPQAEEAARRRQLSFRLNMFFFFTFLLFSVLIVRLAGVQFIEGATLAAEEEQKEHRTISLPPIRGNIYARQETPIADSVSTQSVFYHYDSGRPKEEIIAIADRLSEVLGMAPQDIVAAMDCNYDYEGNLRKPVTPSYMPRRIKSDLTKEQIAYLAWYRDELPGIQVEEESMRRYNEKGIAVQLVGYLRPFNTAKNNPGTRAYYENILHREDYLDKEDVGYDGLELMFQEELRGRNGKKTYPVNAHSQIIGSMEITPPVKGNNLFLTIDEDVQLETERAIEEHLEKIRKSTNKWERAPYATTGYAVAMEVHTGKVRAMVSYPEYNPNDWRGGMKPDVYQATQHLHPNGTIREVYPNYPDQKERNKHPTSLVYLGSTMKPLSVLIGLNEKFFSPNDKYNDLGYYTYGRDNTTVWNSESRAYGPINAQRAISVSSNTFMMAMVSRPLYNKGDAGLELFVNYLKKFGLGVTTGSGLPNEITGTTMESLQREIKASSLQNVLMRATWGQMGRYTTLQLAQYAATLANRGKRMKPLFVEKMTTYDFEPVKTFEPEVLDTIDIPQEYWEVVHQGMLGVNKQGFEGFNIPVAAKTGTSTQMTSAGEVDNAVFIAYAPADKPKLAVAVVIPEGGYGSWGAAPIARKIFEAYDKAIGLYDEKTE